MGFYLVPDKVTDLHAHCELRARGDFSFLAFVGPDEAVLAGTIKELDNRVWDAEALEDEKISSFPVSLMLWRKDMSSFASPLLVLVDVSLRASKYPVVTAWWI